MKTIAVFASGNGTNFQAIVDCIKSGMLKVHIALLVSDKPRAFVLKRAKEANIKTLFADPKKFETRQEYESYIIKRLREEGVELIVLAGFMRILSPFFIKKYKNRILNIHPSLLPAFGGKDAIKKAFCYGVKATGVTVHLVDEKVDHGPIIIQEPLTVLDHETMQDLEARIHQIEHKIYPEAIDRVVSTRFIVRGRKVIFKS
ncbi:MAG: phosphoribosylglycinamide formyltransferase [Candidatus Omnitrophota bacterium]